MTRLVALGLMVTLLAGCSDGASESETAATNAAVPPQSPADGPCAGPQTVRPSTGMCQIGTDACQDFANVDVERGKSVCTTFGGTWAEGKTCPTEKRVGRCMRYCKMDDELVVSYYSDEPESWRNLCLEANGAWLGQ